VAPPSVVAHKAGSNAHPWRSSANRISVTPDACSSVSGARSLPASVHVVPASVVSTTVVHVDWPHGASPSIHPCCGETHDSDWAWNPEGTVLGAAVDAVDAVALPAVSTASHIDVMSRIGERRIGHLLERSKDGSVSFRA
jgi:hypothetical protein